jgi:diacylglycerol kinase family enzyme
VTPPKKQAAVVYNPIKVDLPALEAVVAAAEIKAGWQKSLWYETTEDDPGIGQAKLAVGKGADVVMAAGGDGTVRAVAAALRETGVPVGLLPSGTGNLLARNLDLTLDDLEHAVTTAFMGKNRSIDVGTVEAELPDGTREKNTFLVMAGVGLDAQMIANTNAELKKKVGWLAYVDAIARSLKGNNRVRMRFTVDGSPIRTMTAHTVLVGNCGSLPGNILLLPDAAVDDGVLDVVALRPKGLIGWLQIWVKIVWENGVLRRSAVGRKLMSLTKEVRTLRYINGKSFTARLSRPEEYELDGDPFGKAVALRATVEHLGLVVKVPADE